MIKRIFKRDKRKWELILTFESMQKLGVIVPITTEENPGNNASLFANLEIMCNHEVRRFPAADQSIDLIYETLITEYKHQPNTVYIGNGLHIVNHIIIEFDPNLVPAFPKDTSPSCRIEFLKGSKPIIIFDTKMTDDDATLLIIADEFDDIRLKESFWTKFCNLFRKDS